jgi:MoxR-like ATPase
MSTTHPPFADVFARLHDAVSSILVGKPDAVRQALYCLFAGGHVLLEDVPGVGKTSLARAIAAAVDARWSRIQFTPDLLPSDVTGVTIYNQNDRSFEFHPGGVFANIVIADEINRASPKTQSALLEVMEERRVSVDGKPYEVPLPFLVIATQNPIEMEGTYRLPEAQLDRFLLRLSIGYPSPRDEVEILAGRHEPSDITALRPVISLRDVQSMIGHAASIHASPALLEYVVRLAHATRTHDELALGVSPRASVSLLKVARVAAAAAGRNHVLPDDIRPLVGPVFAHRVQLSGIGVQRRRTVDDVIGEIAAHVPVPRPAGGA